MVRLLAYVIGSANQEILSQNKYLAAENRILRAKLPSRMGLGDPERATLAEIGKRLGRKALREWRVLPNPTRSPCHSTGRGSSGGAHGKVLPLPFSMPAYVVVQHWHERYTHDPASKWLRSVIADLFLRRENHIGVNNGVNGTGVKA